MSPLDRCQPGLGAATIDHMTALLAYTAHPYGWGGGPGLWFLVPATFWLLVLVAAVVWWRRRPADPRPESVLGEAFARGQITEDEYRSRLAVLRETEVRRRG
jgi:putative membrane protein